MARPYLIITLIALVAAAAGAMHLRRAAEAFKLSHNVASIQPEPEPPVKSVSAASVPVPASQDWVAIAAQDPFSFDRTDTPILAPVVQTAAKTRAPKPFLFGTMSIGTDRIALMRSSGGTVRSSRPMKVGDEMEGWKLVQIDDKSVIVEADSVRETLIINDPTAAVPRDYSKTLISSAAAPPPAQMSRPAPPQMQTIVAAPQSDSRPSSGPTKTKVIDTPFGKKVVPDP